MNLRQLRYFVAAVDAGNITRAAKQVHVAQPALGAQLRELELELDAVLLVRHSRGVEPTDAGRLFYERSKAVLELLEKTRQDLADLGAKTRLPLHLGLTTSLAMLIGSDLHLLAQHSFPKLALTVVEAPSFALADAVSRGELDIALAYDVDPSPGLSLTPVLSEELLFVCEKSAAGAEPTVSMTTVMESRLALGGCRDVARRVLAQAIGKIPADLPPAFEVQSVSAIRELVLRGEATSVLPLGAVAADMLAGRVQGRRIANPTVSATLYVVRRSPSRASDPQHNVSLLLDAALAMIAEKFAQHASADHTSPCLHVALLKAQVPIAG